MPKFEKGNNFSKGRVLGSKNKKTLGHKVLEAAMERSDILPIEFMLNMLNDPDEEPGNKMWAAEKAAPYIHSKAVLYTDNTNHDEKELMDEIADLEREIVPLALVADNDDN
jgi:hypothetical protein